MPAELELLDPVEEELELGATLLFFFLWCFACLCLWWCDVVDFPEDVLPEDSGAPVELALDPV